MLYMGMYVRISPYMRGIGQSTYPQLILERIVKSPQEKKFEFPEYTYGGKSKFIPYMWKKGLLNCA